MTPEEREAAIVDLQKFENLTNFLSVLTEERWKMIFEPLLMSHRESASRRALTVPNTQDGAFDASYWRGAAYMAQAIRNALDLLRLRAAAKVEEVRKTRPV